eukprot:3280-Heterococcus_DN1.PRE.3
MLKGVSTTGEVQFNASAVAAAAAAAATAAHMHGLTARCMQAVVCQSHVLLLCNTAYLQAYYSQQCCALSLISL